MRLIDSLILTIYTVALMVLSGLMVVGAIAPDSVQPHVWMANAMATARGQLTIGLVGAVFFGVSVRLIFAAFRTQRGGQPVVHETALGEVTISLDAVENLVRKTARSIKGVREVKADVQNNKDGMHVNIKATISPEVSIPEVSEEMQNAVRQYVKRVVGVDLSGIRLQVENIANEGRRGRLD